MTELLIQFIPVFGIIGLGVLLRRKSILTREIIDGMKQLIVKLGLPALFFLSFLKMEIQAAYLWLFITMFLYCLLLFFIGKFLTKTPVAHDHLNPFFFTGFEFGMVGIALFTSLFGADQLYHIALIGLGHELFIWFVYAPLLQAKERGAVQIQQILKSFFTNPIIIAIITALLLNLSGAYELMKGSDTYLQIEEMITMVGNLTSPLILLALGAQLTFANIQWKPSLKLIFSRLAVVTVSGIALILFVERVLFTLHPLMFYGFITFLLLPPPYIIPVFLGKRHEHEASFYNRTLILYTAAVLVIYPIVMVLAQ